MKNKAGHKSGSIMKKILVPLIILMIIQGCLFCGTILFGGTIEQLNYNAFEILNERVINRKNYIQNEMIQRWSNVEDTVAAVNSKVDNILSVHEVAPYDVDVNSDYSVEIISSIAEDVIYMLKKNSVTGAFVVLEGNDPQIKTGIYMRDLDPTTNASDNTDVLMERSPTDVFRDLGLAIDTNWQPNFDFNPDEPQERYAFYYKPFNAAQKYQHVNYQDLGYWSMPFKLSDGDIDVITYSVPLMYDDGMPYGVLGIEITLDYLRKLLPYDEITPDKKGAYLLAVDNGNEFEFKSLLSAGPAYKQLFGSQGSVMFNHETEYNNSYKIKLKNDDENEAYGCIQYFKLYNSNTPFENDKWALVGILRESELTSFSVRVKTDIYLSMLIFLAIGLIGAVLVSKLVTSPITSLAKKVKDSDPLKPVNLEKINITEIDELSSAIENLSISVADSSSKLSQIIEAVNLSIGAFEWRKGSDIVYYTGSFSDMFKFDDSQGSGYIDRESFKNIMAGYDQYIESVDPDGNRIYKIVNKFNTPRWVRLKVIESDNRKLGVVVDITQEAIEKRKIEYERDYDLLTDLLNRRAFHASLTKLFRYKEVLQQAALIMIDLDNLKYINDTYGHDYGDSYIKCTANALRESAPYNAIISRMSGDEFYLFIYGYKDKKDIRDIVSNIRNNVRNTVLPLPDNSFFKIRASAGVAWYPDDSDSYEQLIKYADFAMYEVKNTVKGEFKEFDINSYNKDSFLLHNKEEFNKLIDDQLVEYAFQPIVSAKTGEVFAYEALMRSKLDTLKNVYEILRLARSQSKLYQIEHITWFKALEYFLMQEDKSKDKKLFFNSIPNQMLSNDDLAEFESRYKDYLGRIVIELTEEEKMNNGYTEVKQFYAKKWGGEIALDDFGSGYNGETVLLQMAPDYVKVDMEIVRNIDTDENRLRIFRNICGYAQERHIKVIAEGVETRSEMEVLIRNGVDLLQGYYIGMPILEIKDIDKNVKDDIININKEIKD